MSLRSAMAMLFPAVLSRASALCLFTVGLGATVSGARAETAPPAVDSAAVAKPVAPENLSQAELLRSYLDVRDQLRTAQLAIVNNRLEAEAAARAQSAAIGEKLDVINAAMVAERERDQAAAQKLELEREREQADAQHTTRTILLLASIFGGLGLLAMLVLAVFQWRAINRPPAAAPLPARLPPGFGGFPGAELDSPADQTVAMANRGLLATIGRMEQRIFQLEHTTSQPVTPPKPTGPVNQAVLAVNGDPHFEQNARFANLLNKGRTLLKSNKVMEALDCYDEILKADPNHPEALVKKGTTLERLKQDNEAIRCYDRAIKADRNMTLAYICKAGLFSRLERFSEAVECYEQALQVAEESKT